MTVEPGEHTEDLIIDALDAADDALSAHEIADATGRHVQNLRIHLYNLEIRGEITFDSVDEGQVWRRYYSLATTDGATDPWQAHLEELLRDSQAVGLSGAETLDFLAVRVCDIDPDDWADTRAVVPGTVQAHVRTAAKQIDARDGGGD